MTRSQASSGKHLNLQPKVHSRNLLQDAHSSGVIGHCILSQQHHSLCVEVQAESAALGGLLRAVVRAIITMHHCFASGIKCPCLKQ